MRTVYIYGAGRNNEAGQHSVISATFNGDVVYQGIVLVNKEYVVPIDNNDLMFSFNIPYSLSGSVPLQITVQSGDVTVGADDISNIKIEIPDSFVINDAYLNVPADLKARVDSTPNVEDLSTEDRLWIRNNLTHNYKSSDGLTQLGYDNKMNVFINEISQSPTITSPLKQNSLHYELKAGDVFVCDFWVSEGLDPSLSFVE